MMDLDEGIKITKRKQLLPVVALRGKVAFPNTTISFDVGREYTVKAIDLAMQFHGRTVFICTQKDVEKEDVESGEDVFSVGTVAKIRNTLKTPDGTLRVSVDGLYRAKTKMISSENGYFVAVTEEILPITKDEVLEEAYFRTAKEIVKDLFENGNCLPRELSSKLETLPDINTYINVTANAMRIKNEVKQELLEEEHTLARLKLFEKCLTDEAEISKIERKISSTVRQNIEKSQKEYFLREQLRAIHDELGDNADEEDEYRKKVEDKHLPDAVKEKCLKEIDRMQRMQQSSPEYTVIAGYLDWILDLPWTEETKDTEKLSDCKKVLEADHYGLEKIKERILEYLAVLKLKGDMKAPILCFVGPPGVGKTSIAQSIARALNRKFVRMSLGGVKDEAEIRGHRKTYIGAMPGRIIYAMKNAGSINPVFLLDEIDKISSDLRGDPASALLEVLDPEQNATFRDRFLEVEYDLSKVMFITTANTLDTIPSPLLDRMEVIELSGYTLEEKSEIAKHYLVPKQLKENGLKPNAATFTDSGLKRIIEGYTMEAGVRTLERTIGTVCRKIAVKSADSQDEIKVKVDKDAVLTYLGAMRFTGDEKRFTEETGAVTGLAWTAVGGTTLTVEATTMPGKGELRLTGKLGDVMKESAFAGLSFIRSHAEEYGIDGQYFAENDIHIHVPEGATPKDGPSAGITMATAILSAILNKKVRKDVAMTGEITLRGKVLPIGGLKEKSLAARRIGIKNVIIPCENQKDLEEIPEKIRQEINFIPVSNVEEVFSLAIVGYEKNEPVKTKKHTLTVKSERENIRCEKA